MKFETGSEQAWRDAKKEKGEELSFLDKYKDFNCEKAPQLLTVRGKNQKDFEEREKARKASLREVEEEGEIVCKKI